MFYHGYDYVLNKLDVIVILVLFVKVISLLERARFGIVTNKEDIV